MIVFLAPSLANKIIFGAYFSLLQSLTAQWSP